jgi:DNA-binding transcriptional MerR regulator
LVIHLGNPGSIELVSQKLNITAREILFYRKRGLLCALAEGASTFITEKDFARLKVILAGKRAGFMMIQIEKLMKNRNNTRLIDLENYFILKKLPCSNSRVGAKKA